SCPVASCLSRSQINGNATKIRRISRGEQAKSPGRKTKQKPICYGKQIKHSAERALLMTRTIRQIAPEDKWCQLCSPALFQDQLSDEQIREVLTNLDAWEERERKLNMPTTIWISILLTLAPRTSIASFLNHFFASLEQFDESDDRQMWTDTAWRARRN